MQLKYATEKCSISTRDCHKLSRSRYVSSKRYKFIGHGFVMIDWLIAECISGSWAAIYVGPGFTPFFEDSSHNRTIVAQIQNVNFNLAPTVYVYWASRLTSEKSCITICTWYGAYNSGEALAAQTRCPGFDFQNCWPFFISKCIIWNFFITALDKTF